jgi:hypothetical protein
METLHVRADRQTSSRLRMGHQHTHTQLISMIPSSKIALHINNTNISSYYVTHLRKATTHPAILKHYIKHYGWNTTQSETIDWKVHHGAIHKIWFTEKKCIAKCIHQSLTMSKVFHKIDPSQKITCRSCKLHPELESQLYHCPTLQATMEDILFHVTLHNFYQDNYTCLKLTHTLLDTLYCNPNDTQYPKFCHCQHGANEPHFRKLHQTQAYIGWSQLFQCRLVQDWSQFQDKFLEDNNDELKLDQCYYTGNIWVWKLTNLLCWGTSHAHSVGPP